MPLKDKKGITITNAFQDILDESNCKPNKILLDKCSEFYNRPMKLFSQNNDVEMYSTHNEEKSVVTERFIGTINNKIHKYMTSVSKNVYNDKLDDIVDKYNTIKIKMNKYNTIKMKPVIVKSSSYIDSSKENSEKDIKIKIGNIVRISKYKNIFPKNFTSPWTYAIIDLNGKEIIGTFYEKKFQKINKKEFRIEKVIKKKDEKLYVKWNGYNTSFNS